MASDRKEQLTAKGKHTVGQVESWKMDTVINGAIVEEMSGIDNFVLGELVFTEKDEAHVKLATNGAKAEDTVLVCTPEVRLAGEPLCNFYNKKGERATCAILTPNFQFSTSKVESPEELEIGDVVEFQDGTFKKVMGGVDSATGKKVFRVVAKETDAMYSIDGQTLVSLNVIK